MNKQAKLRSAYCKCAVCGGTGIAAVEARKDDARTRLFEERDGEEVRGEAAEPPQHAFKPLYRPAADPNAADPFVEDPFSGFAPRRWKEAWNRRSCVGDSVVRSGKCEEAFVYNASYLGQGDDHRIWFEQDESMRRKEHAADDGRCEECSGAGVVRVEWKAELSIAPAFVLLGVASCAAAYTERPLLTAAVYGAALLAARIVRFGTERYFVTGPEVSAAKRKTGLQPVHQEAPCKCELADSYN